MHRPNLYIAVFLPIILVYPLLISGISSQAAFTTLQMAPSTTTADLQESFSVNTTISNVTDLGGWEFKLYYRNNIITANNAVEGPFLKQGGSTAFFVVEFDNNYNETHGRLWLTCTLLGSSSGVNGSGTFAIISFTAVGSGSTTLHFSDTVLGNSSAQPIPHTPMDGEVIVIPPVTITNIAPFATIAAQGAIFPINVSTLNEGNSPVTFNLTTHYNETAIETKTITQTNGSVITSTFVWNTTGLSLYKSYIINANTTYSTLEDGVIIIVRPGDVDVDRDVDIFDIVLIASAYGSQKGSPIYNPNLDVNCDNKIDIFDIVTAAGNYGYEQP